MDPGPGRPGAPPGRLAGHLRRGRVQEPGRRRLAGRGRRVGSGWSGNIAIRCKRIPGRSPKGEAPSPNRRKRPRVESCARRPVSRRAGSSWWRPRISRTRSATSSVISSGRPSSPKEPMIRKEPSGSPCGDSSGTRPGGCSKAGEITDSLSVMALLHEAVRRLEEAKSMDERVRFPAGSYFDGLERRGLNRGRRSLHQFMRRCRGRPSRSARTGRSCHARPWSR